MKRTFLPLILALLAATAFARPFTIKAGQGVTIAIEGGTRPVTRTAAELVARDLAAVLDAHATLSTDTAKADVVVSINPEAKPQSFTMTSGGGRLHIVGGDSHGAAYGLMHLSRLVGVSPWEWWADATPQKRKAFSIKEGYRVSQAPSVEYRGIFINDEDWGLMPWACTNYEPTKRGVIGPRTTARIFELMLRLRANYYWPPMHECSQPFFLTEGNREVAARYGIYIGGSHCEPMASSTAGEWPRRGHGDYDYVHNADSVRAFWEQRLREVAGQEIVYTIGMRGVHDGAMNGAKTVGEQKAVLERAFRDQRELLRQYVNDDVTRVPQVFIPYKEVLDVYNAGLSVPDDVTLMWCDDNYGYIRHFPTAEERDRRGGNGIYYHVSYWGRPHDYLWLGTFSPGLLFQQMSEAWDRGIQRMWILNVGDIKPAEYQTELFMDMAWDMEGVRRQGVERHLAAFLTREFGAKTAGRVLPAMIEHYRLAFIHKPEFMGATRTEEWDPIYNKVKDLPWTDDYCRQRIADYDRIERIVAAQAPPCPPKGGVGLPLCAAVPPSGGIGGAWASYYQLVEYPVSAAAEMNKKLLYAQLARHGADTWAESAAAYDSIVSLTQKYNTPKWRGMMDMKPRRLPVFDSIAAPPSPPEGGVVAHDSNILSPLGGKGGAIPLLGYNNSAISLKEGESIDYAIAPPIGGQGGTLTIEVCLLPTHPVNGKTLRFTLTLDGHASQPIHYETAGRSEEWKENVLWNRASRRLTLPLGKGKRHTLTLTALDDGVIVDEVSIMEKE